MRREIYIYISVFLVIFIGALGFVVPNVNSAPLSDGDIEAYLGNSSRFAEGINLEEELLRGVQPQPENGSNTANNQNDKKQLEENLQKIQELYRFIDSHFIHELDHEKMYEHLVNALFSALDDPYSAYIPEEKSSRITDTTTGVYGGIGAYISKPDPAYKEADDPSSYMVTVVSPFQGSPAHRAGLQAGDLISHIDGEPVDKLSAEEASNKLRGEEGTTVTVTIYHSEDLSQDISITREVVAVPTVEYDMIDSVGYLKILQFTPVTPEKVVEALEKFEEKGYESLILDVRQNPGGEFSAVRRIADLFLDDGVIVSTESRVPGQSRIFRATPRKIVPSDLPVVVLVDGGSASGSEILAGALQDNNRATVIGTNTFGKGYVQGVFPFERDFFKITISKYLTPDNQNIEEHGISPNIIVEEEKLTDKERNSYTELLTSGKLEEFVDEHPEKKEAPIGAFIETLQEDEEFILSERHIRALIRQEYYRRMDFPPIFDLDHDKALQRALDYLLDEEVAAAI